MRDPAAEQLREASEGLVYVSEMDAPFTAFEWDFAGELTPEAVRQLGGHGEAPVVEAQFDSFFAGLTREQEWHGEEEREQIRKYRELQAVVAGELAAPRAYRAGETEVTYYVVGRSPAGRWVGVKTEAVQT